MNKQHFYYNFMMSGNNIMVNDKDRKIARKMDTKPCPGGLTVSPANKYLSVSKFFELTHSFYIN